MRGVAACGVGGVGGGLEGTKLEELELELELEELELKLCSTADS